MFKFNSEQKVFQIHQTSIGGQPGEYPTVLIGSIFFQGHHIVIDPQKGLFDKVKAKDLLHREAEVSSLTGNSRMIDVIGYTSQALTNYIEFVASQSDSPILVDSPLPQIRMETIQNFKRSDLIDRLVYNSIGENVSEDELQCIKDCNIGSAVLLAFSEEALKPDAKIQLLQKKLLPAAKKAGIRNILIDVGVIDIPSVSWASSAIWHVKEILGFPAGCAPSNALYNWNWIKQREPPSFEAASSSTFSLPQIFGANFIFYGPIRNANWVYPVCATNDAMIAYFGRISRISPKTKVHPLFKIFSNQ